MMGGKYFYPPRPTSPCMYLHFLISASTSWGDAPRRKGAGLPLFGKSFTYAAARPNMRIDFQFDNAAFHFRFLPFTIPYPVPFRLLGDETKVCVLCGQGGCWGMRPRMVD